MPRLFVTGASGFLGRTLVDRLRRAGASCVCLQHSGRIPTGEGSGPGSLEVVQADLLEPSGYREALATADAVLHLAAATGKATAEEHFRVNGRGTEVLLEQCREAGTRRFLFVSSIAVKFADKTRYFYAQAKTQAEEHVRSSGLSFVVVRPTIIVGPGSPGLAALARLAGLPVVPVFGNGRTLVQPIYVEDLAELLAVILEEDRFRGETLELGGPAALPIEEFLQQIRRILRGRPGRSIHVPLGLLLPCLSVAESVAYRFLPFTIGQLASFRFDGTAEDNDLQQTRSGSLRTVPRMLELSLTG